MESLVKTAKTKKLVSVFTDTKYSTQIVKYLLKNNYTVTSQSKVIKTAVTNIEDGNDKTQRYDEPRELLKLAANNSIETNFLIIPTEKLNQYEKISAELCSAKDIITIIVSPNVAFGEVFFLNNENLGNIKTHPNSNLTNIVDLAKKINSQSNVLILCPNYGVVSALNKQLNTKHIYSEKGVVVSTTLNDAVFGQYNSIIIHPRLESKIYKEEQSKVVIDTWRSKQEVILIRYLAKTIYLLTDKELKDHILYIDDTIHDILLTLYGGPRGILDNIHHGFLNNNKVKDAVSTLKKYGLIDWLNRTTDIGAIINSYGPNLHASLFLNNWLVFEPTDFKFPGIVIATILEKLSVLTPYSGYDPKGPLHSFLQLWYDITTELKEELLDQFAPRTVLDFEPIYTWCRANSVRPHPLIQLIISIKKKCSLLNINTIGRFSVDGAIDLIIPHATTIYKNYIAKRNRKESKYESMNTDDEYKYVKYPELSQYRYLAVLEHVGHTGEIVVALPTNKPDSKVEISDFPKLDKKIEYNYLQKENLNPFELTPIVIETIVDALE